MWLIFFAAVHMRGARDQALTASEDGEHAMHPGHGAIEAEAARLEIDGAGKHDARHQHPEQAGTGRFQPFRWAVRGDRRGDRRNRLSKRIERGLAHDWLPLLLRNVATSDGKAREAKCLLSE